MFWIQRLLLLVGLATPLLVSAGQTEANAIVDEANALYQESKYKEALDSYTSLYDAGYRSAELCYNIGNCYFKMKDMTRSILYYERALRLDPSDEEIKYNLSLARSRIIDKIETVPELFFIRWWNQLRDLFGADGWAMVSILSFCTFLTLILLFLLIRSAALRKIIIWPALLVLVILFHALAFAYQKKSILTNRPDAIIFKPTLTVKSSPDENSIDLFVIHEGTKVTITDELYPWLEIRIASGNKGWVDKSALERI